MSLSPVTQDRERAKFRDAGGTLSRVAVTIENDSPLDVSYSPDLPAGYVAVNYFNQISSVPSGSLSTVLSKTISSTFATIDSIEIGGDNKAEFRIFINTVLVAVKRTGFTELNAVVGFGGLKLVTSDVLEVKVIHQRPFVGVFEARILGVEKT